MARKQPLTAEEVFERFNPGMTIRPEYAVTNPMADEYRGVPARGNWWNFVPSNAVNRLVEAEDKGLELHKLTQEALDAWMSYAEDSGEFILTGNDGLGAYKALERRAVKPALAEIAVSQLFDVAPFPRSKSGVRRLERAGIDIITKSGHSIQVKFSSKPPAPDAVKRADELIWVEKARNGQMLEIHRHMEEA